MARPAGRIHFTPPHGIKKSRPTILRGPDHGQPPGIELRSIANTGTERRAARASRCTSMPGVTRRLFHQPRGTQVGVSATNKPILEWVGAHIIPHEQTFFQCVTHSALYLGHRRTDKIACQVSPGNNFKVAKFVTSAQGRRQAFRLAFMLRDFNQGLKFRSALRLGLAVWTAISDGRRGFTVSNIRPWLRLELCGMVSTSHFLVPSTTLRHWVCRASHSCSG